MLRGALVLAVGALDGLVLEGVLEVVGPAARAGALGSLGAKWIRDNPEKVLGALASADPYDELTEVARNSLGQITFQRSTAIEGVLRDVANIPPPWSKAALALTDAKSKWTEDRVKASLDAVVERRHRIAHAGDLRSDARSARPITVEYVRDAARLIRAVGEATCVEIDDMLRTFRRSQV
jgi:hypothetical protein